MRGATPKQRKRTLTTLGLILTLGGGTWWLMSGERIDDSSPAPASVEVALDRDTESCPDVGATINITLRWGHTDSAAPTTSDDNPKPSVVWDGFLALDCGRFAQVEPLSFELDDPKAPDARPFADFLGPPTRGDSGDQRLYWRSKTRQAWDGLRVKIVACAGDPSRTDEGGSTLRVHTTQRDYTARLSWCADDFVSLPTARLDQKLEVYTHVEYDQRALAGARITALPASTPSVF